MKAFNNPPAGVKLVMESVCVMKGINPERIPDPAGTGRRVTKRVQLFNNAQMV
jgi:dynein heavy chain